MSEWYIIEYIVGKGGELCQEGAGNAPDITVMMNFLTGSYQHNIDAKGRLTVPAKLREQLGESFYLTKGIDGCIFVYPEREWEAFLERLCALPLAQAAPVQRHFISNSALVECDSMGRILIPKNLREFAALEKDTMFLGVGRRAEIWSTPRYEEVSAALSQADILETMSQVMI